MGLAAMDTEIKKQITQLHGGRTKAVISLTGGGVQVLSWLLGIPGASRTILEAVLPYSDRSLSAYLGYEPERMVTPAVAMDMARTAYQRGLGLSENNDFLVGVGSSAAIVTDREKKGAHRCFTVAWTNESTTQYSVTLTKGIRDRQGEDELVSKVILQSLVETDCVSFNIDIGLNAGEKVEIERREHPALIGKLLTGQIETLTVCPDGRMIANESLKGGVLSGSFDPLHKGHESLSDLAEQILQIPVVFELSVSNVDKASLVPSVLGTRVAQFRGKHTVVLTNAPKFNEKAVLFPDCTFVIGLDTATRLLDPVYYDGDVGVATSLQRIKNSGCRFLVAGRFHEGAFRTLEDIRVPTEYLDIFTSLSEAEFRDDASSSAMRCQKRKGME